MNNLLKPKLILEYAVIDSIGRNKGWHMHGLINSLDDLPEIVNEIKISNPNKQVKTKIYEYTTAFGSVQIA